MENCTKFGQLILSKIIKIVATRCQIARLKCTKFDFGSAPDSAVGAYSVERSPRPASWIKSHATHGHKMKLRRRFVKHFSHILTTTTNEKLVTDG